MVEIHHASVARLGIHAEREQPIAWCHALRAIVFDWGGTLYDIDRQCVFPQAPWVVACLAQHCVLHVVSGREPHAIAERVREIARSPLAPYFTSITVANTQIVGSKDQAYALLLAHYGYSPASIAVVDDHVHRGIQWGNHHRATTIWIRQGQRRTVEPTEHTGQPSYTIDDLGALLRL